MLGFTNSGGFAGFSGFGGQPNFGCTDQTVQACTCPSGTNGVEQCSNGNWGPCRCSSAFGSGGASGCTDDCFYSFNGVCDDGAAGSSTARCAYGTDCSDCGIRTLGAGGFGGGFGSTGGFRGTGGHVVDAGRGPRDASADVSSGRVDASTDAAPDAPFVPAD
jgi:hypothetical protein